MHRANSIFRSSLVCSLILSLGMVGFCSQPVAAIGHAECGKSATGATKIRTCCCANCDGRCGGACCRQNGTKPVPPAAPGRSNNEKHNTVVLVVEVGSLVEGNTDAGARHGDPSSFDGMQAVVSLQSQHVRIQT
jgi:hypothetical protein